MEENTEMITYLESRIQALQDTYIRYKELEGVGQEPNLLSLHYNSVAAVTQDCIDEMKKAKDVYLRITTKTETV